MTKRKFVKDYIKFKDIFHNEIMNKYSQSTTDDEIILKFYKLYLYSSNLNSANNGSEVIATRGVGSL